MIKTCISAYSGYLVKGNYAIHPVNVYVSLCLWSLLFYEVLNVMKTSQKLI